MVALYVTSPAGIRFPRTSENVAAFEQSESDVAAQEEEPKNVEVIVTDEREAGELTQVFEVDEGVDEREAGELTQGLGVDVGVEVELKLM